MATDYLQEIKSGHLWEKYFRGALEEVELGKYRVSEVRAATILGLDAAISKVEHLIQEEKTHGRDSKYWEKKMEEDKQRKFDLIRGRETTFSNGRIKIPIR